MFSPMTSNIINLRKARKAKARAGKDRSAEENRAEFGRTKVEREAQEKRRRKAEKILDAHRRPDSENEET